MKTKSIVLLICGLCCFFACKNENSNKSTRTNGQDYSDYDEAVEGNPGEPIKKWFPKALVDYRLDESTIEMVFKMNIDVCKDVFKTRSIESSQT